MTEPGNQAVQTGGNASAPPDRTELRAKEQLLLEHIRQIATGDQAALGRLYDATNRLVFGLILRILNDTGAAEEVTLEVYMQVWRQAADYDIRRGTPSAWLLMMARSRAIDRFRAGDQERRRAEALDTVTARSTNDISPEEQASETERRRMVQTALAELPPEQRQVIELAYFGGLSHSEISEKLSQPLGTVKTRIRLAMNRLRDALKLLDE
ncbi:MAG: sigma-70 family RNA polymerase sigma factor [Blastocatellia bacterium]|nr:sigma-70 family RNA polymerase sigma factor [Blastocatellia bacterium]